MRYIGGGTEPALVTAETFKRQSHILEADVADDSAITFLLQAAQASVLTAANMAPAAGLYEFTWPLTGDGWRRFWFPCRPVTDLVGLAVRADGGGWVDQPLDGVQLVQSHDEPQLLLPARWPGFASGADTLRVQVTAGGDVPAQLPQAIIMLAREWQRAGIAIEDTPGAPRLSFGVTRLIRQARYTPPRMAAPC